jgi:hypothetical protein
LRRAVVKDVYDELEFDHSKFPDISRTGWFGLTTVGTRQIGQERLQLYGYNPERAPLYTLQLIEEMPSIIQATVGRWMQMSLRSTNGFMTGTVRDGNISQSIQKQRAATPGIAIYPYLLGWNVENGALQKIRNVTVKIYESDTCSNLKNDDLTYEAIKEILADTCGDDACATYEQYLACAFNKIDELREAGTLLANLESQMREELSAKSIFCDGYQQCVDEVDPEAIRAAALEEGFAAGVASVDLEGAATAAYNEGFAAGEQSVDVGSHYQSGYGDGYAAGVASVPPCPPVTPCPEPTITPEPTPTPPAGMSREEAKALIEESCPCDKAKNHGRYVSCVAKVLKQLLAQGLIDGSLKGELQAEAAQSQCGKKRLSPAQRGRRQARAGAAKRTKR